MLLQNIRNEPWIQIIVVIALFIIGIIIAISLVKSYNKYQQKLEIFSEVKDSSFKLLIILNLVWLIFSLLGIFISFFLFNFNFFYVLNIIDILMIIANIIIGTLLYMKFYNKDYKNSLVTITIIQIILYGIGIFFNLFFKVFLEAIETIPLEEQGIYLLAYIVGVGVTISITIFFAKLGSKIQLVYELTNMIALIAVIPGLIYISVNFLINPTGVYYEVSQIVTTVVIVSIIITIILKKVSYRTIPSRDIEEMKVLEKGEALLDIKNLKVHYPLLKGVLRKQIGAVKAVDGVSFSIKAGETVGLVGESGCGKTTVAMAILGLVEKKSGEILLEGEPLPTDYTSKIRKTIQIVFQDPDASLNPQLKVVDLIAEPIKNIYGVTNKTKLRKQVLKLLEEVSLKKEHLDRYPHEFSGGQKQRIVIARALACNPELIILDEPTSALDVSVQAQILNLLRDLQKTYHYGFLFITHDLSVVYHIADTIAVMYLGKIVEIGDKKLVFSNPTHPYTKALLASRSEVSADDQEIKFVLSGEVPSPIAPPPGCSFHPRCYAESYNELCRKEEPHMIKVEDGHYIWCVNEEVLRESHEFVFE